MGLSAGDAVDGASATGLYVLSKKPAPARVVAPEHGAHGTGGIGLVAIPSTGCFVFSETQGLESKL
ncbi:MAG: hypothetical protein M3328_07400 [Chloroflexota bacterium]|nr:hypothetical protein [Chloroflexota bacterium]